MKLHYSAFSPNCRRVLAVANHLGLNLDLVKVDVQAGENKRPEYLKLNPNGLVPTLDDGGYILWESIAITQYLCEKQGDQNLWPKDLKARSDVNRWQLWGAIHWSPSLSPFVSENIFKKMRGGEADQAVLAKAQENADRFCTVLNNHLEGRDYLCGKSITLADYSVAAPLGFMTAAQMPVPNYKRILGWYERLEKLDAWKKSAPPPLPGR